MDSRILPELRFDKDISAESRCVQELMREHLKNFLPSRMQIQIQPLIEDIYGVIHRRVWLFVPTYPEQVCHEFWIKRISLDPHLKLIKPVLLAGLMPPSS
jgi:hypothetical protein